MKKLTAAALAALLLLAGCAKDDADVDTTTETTETTVMTTVETTTETTAETTEAPVDLDALLEGMEVYDIKYTESYVPSEIDNIYAENKKKYNLGDPDLLFAYRFTEYPDVIIIGVITGFPPEGEATDKAKGIKSVIWKGVEYGTPEYYDAGGHFGVFVTDDFICIDTFAGLIAEAYFVYEGGAEYHKYPNSLKDSHPYFSMENGILKYSCVSSQYQVASTQVAGDFYYKYKSHDDYYGSEGEIKLVDGKIVYDEKISYTLEEWYEDYSAYDKEKYGNTLDEFLESIRIIYDLEKEDLGRYWRNLNDK